MQGKFDANGLLCHNKSARREENKKCAFEQKKIFFAFKWIHCNPLKVQEEVS